MEKIYDGHNWLRRRLERGSTMRLCLAELRGQPGTIVFDGFGAKKVRKALYPEYKARRNTPDPGFFKQLEYFESLCRFAPVAKIRVPGWEADDVIATLIRREPNADFHVETTDVDFLQLPRTVISHEKVVTIPQKWIRLYKTLVGDPSDNIKGVKGFGKKGWDSLTDEQRTILQDYITGDIHIETDFPMISPKFNAAFLNDIQQLRVYWKIVGLFDVPWDEIIKHTTFGTDDFEGMDAELNKYLG